MSKYFQSKGRIHQILKEENQGVNTLRFEEDDDFSHFSSSSDKLSSSSLNTPTIMAFTNSNVSLSSTSSSTSLSMLTNDSIPPPQGTFEPAPFLSPASEAELYMLATNFLLYVAMVLIITMIAKIYFPHTLIPRSDDHSSPTSEANRVYQKKETANPSPNQEESTATPTKRSFSFLSSLRKSYSYRRILHDEEHFSLEESLNMATLKVQQQEEEENGEMDCPSKGSPAAVEDGLCDSTRVTTNSIRGTATMKENQKVPPKKKNKSKTRNPLHSNFSSTLPSSSSPATHMLFEFDPETSSRTDVLKRLTFCAISLNITFVVWGLVQERMLTRRYPRYTGEYFTYSYALVFTNRFWTLVMSGFLFMYLKPQRSRTTIIYEYSFPSISNMLSSWCQYEALRYVSFPAMTLFKSFKLAPVMAMGVVLGNKRYPQYDYWVALVIGIGITMFMSSTDDLKISFRYNAYEEQAQQSEVWTGVMLLLFFLFFDSFTSQWQSRMFQRHRDLSMVELMFATSAFSTLLSLITLIHTQELGPAIQFMYRHSEIHVHFFIFSICSTIGQLLIFYTIKNFGAVVFTIIMTIRILLSIGLSVILYHHQVTTLGFFGLMFVLAAICYRMKKKAQSSNIIKWKGMDDDKAYELVREWHEHVDM